MQSRCSLLGNDNEGMVPAAQQTDDPGAQNAIQHGSNVGQHRAPLLTNAPKGMPPNVTNVRGTSPMHNCPCYDRATI